MDFMFDEEEQQVIAEAARAVSVALPVNRLRSSEECPGWSQLGRLGWLSLAVPDELGGGGARPPVIAGVMREAGRCLAVDDFVNNAYLLPRILASGSRADSVDWLSRLYEVPGFLFVDGRSQSLVGPDGGGVVRCFGVGPGFDVYRLSARDGYPVLERWLHESASVTPLGGLSPGTADVQLVGPPAASLRVAPLDPELTTQAGLYQAAALVGLAEEALARTVAYVQDRVQFGGPIGRFQALKHILADVYARNEAAWSSALYAAAATVSEDVDAVECRSSRLRARVQGLRAAREAVKAMSQLHGGIGYTWEVDVHWFLKTVLDASARFGGLEAVSEQLGALLVSAC